MVLIVQVEPVFMNSKELDAILQLLHLVFPIPVHVPEQYAEQYVLTVFDVYTLRMWIKVRSMMYIIICI